MIAACQDLLLSAIPEKEYVEIKGVKTGFTVYFFGIKAMEFTFMKTKNVLKIIDEVEGKASTSFNHPHVSVVFQDAHIITDQKERILNAWAYCESREIVDSFGCCSYFEKCSDEKKCIFPHDREYRGCLYRQNLEAGRIFYGKNKNC